MTAADVLRSAAIVVGAIVLSIVGAALVFCVGAWFGAPEDVE